LKQNKHKQAQNTDESIDSMDKKWVLDEVCST